MKMMEGWSLRASEKRAATSLFDSPNLFSRLGGVPYVRAQES